MRTQPQERITGGQQETLFDLGEPHQGNRLTRSEYERSIAPSVRRDTSAAAARSTRRDAPHVAARMLALIDDRGRHGATCDELESETGMLHQTVSSKVRFLVKDGLIEDSGERRQTRHGRPAAVYMRIPGIRPSWEP